MRLLSLRTDYLLFLLLFLLFSAMGCQKKSIEKTSVQSHKENEKPSSRNQEFSITISEGGGFTGLVRGFTLYSTGTVQHWQRFPGQKDSILWSHQAEAGQIQAFKNQIEQSGLLQKTIRESGNITKTLTLATTDSSYTWSWGSAGAKGAVPGQLTSLYRALQGFTGEIRKEKK